MLALPLTSEFFDQLVSAVSDELERRDRAGVLTADQAATRLGVSTRTIRNMVAKGDLPRAPGLSCIRIPERAIEAITKS